MHHSVRGALDQREHEASINLVEIVMSSGDVTTVSAMRRSALSSGCTRRVPVRSGSAVPLLTTLIGKRMT